MIKFNLKSESRAHRLVHFVLINLSVSLSFPDFLLAVIICKPWVRTEILVINLGK